LRECYVAVTGNRARRSHLALWRRNEMRAQWDGVSQWNACAQIT
jgi:hypothetical protein